MKNQIIQILRKNKILCFQETEEAQEDNEHSNKAYNIQRAYEIYSEQGWRPWGAYTDLSYLAFYK